jgi:Domain of unknown function (DUF4157)
MSSGQKLVAKKPDCLAQAGHGVAERAMRQAPVHPLLELQGTIGNQAVLQLLRSGTVQAKLTINQPGDPYEQEADRIADQVMASPKDPGVRSAPPRIQRSSGQSNGQMDAAPASVDQALSSSGRPLEPALRQDMEQRFGHDFSRVRVHSGVAAEQSARDVNAHAYTVENNIVFGAGRCAPGTREGQRLLAHELVHVVQQAAGVAAAAQHSNSHPTSDTARACPAIVQRQPQDPKKGAKPKPTAPVPGPGQRLYVVRDKELQLGGELVKDLDDFKRKVMSTKTEADWTLVLSIHGSEERLGAQAPPDWQKNAIFYQAADIEKLFNNDKDFVKWRDRYGPTFLSLVSCQVSASFEGTLIANLTRAGAGGQRQPGRGLGAGCKPIASTQHFTDPDAPKTRRDFNKLSSAKQKSYIERLKDLNQKWGYYGAPPVPDDQVLHYYYDEEPKGEWVQVEVMVGKEHDVAKLRKTGIPFWNRTTGPDAAKFRELCSQGVGELKREHTPVVPPVKD